MDRSIRQQMSQVRHQDMIREAQRRRWASTMRSRKTARRGPIWVLRLDRA